MSAVHLQKSALAEVEQRTATTAKDKQLVELSQDSTFEASATSELGAVYSPGSGDQEMAREKCKLQKENNHPEQLEHPSEKETSADEHHHLHLSSCHECLELENSTIESVRFASAENIPDLPDDYSSSVEDRGDTYATGELNRTNLSGKPPNILIYVGSDPEKDKFEEIKSIIMETVDIHAYTVYQLLEEHMLNTPWLDNALLLVIAAPEPISDAASKQFLIFMSKGGKVLGLSTSFTFGGIQVKSKNELMGTVQALVFSKAKNSKIKLNILASGKIFEKENVEELDSVEALGYLDSSDNDMMIVHLPYGNKGGGAILCQVRCTKALFFSVEFLNNIICRKTKNW